MRVKMKSPPFAKKEPEEEEEEFCVSFRCKSVSSVFFCEKVFLCVWCSVL
tara:strand:- start:1944 stop:2093 length:150 start_codon:yes stop_codon:yes gene_type:complete